MTNIYFTRKEHSKLQAGRYFIKHLWNSWRTKEPRLNGAMNIERNALQ